jgi:3-deoxy-manno-octulosonate cytidylyltransferase (CMP-KDO synthetase)
MKILCVIPSRIGSTRLARKPLLPIRGKPMVQWVYEKAKNCSAIDDVIVATDSDEIKAVIEQAGGRAFMTPAEIPTGSDRVALVADAFPEMDVIINLQGDEPFVEPSMLEELIAPYLRGEQPEMTTLAYPLDLENDYQSPDFVKVITDQLGNAIYFSRSPIPYFRVLHEVPVYHHIGLYAFSRDFLKVYRHLPATPLEKVEALEQLRVIEHGYKIKVCLTRHRTLEINTQEEFERAQLFDLEVI